MRPPSPAGPSGASHPIAIDLALLTTVFIWAANYSVVKRCFTEIPPQPFNALRIFLAALVYQVGIWVAARHAPAGAGAIAAVFRTPAPVTRRDLWQLLALGVIGHFCYQFCFAAGLDGTNVSNAALIIASTPVVVAIFAALLGYDRITPFHWLGAAVSALGIYIVVGRDASFHGPTFHGDLYVFLSVGCWAAYTLGSARLLDRHSPLYVTGMTMAFGGLPYVLVMLPGIVRVDWAHVSTWTMIALPLSSLFALCLGYLLWYTGVQRIGAARTSLYSNMVPVAAMIVAYLWLGEPVSRTQILGATGVISGVLLTRIGRARQVPVRRPG